MKLLCVGDWHLRIRCPVNRKGNFYEDQIQKLEFIFDTAVENDCRAILQSGDLGDSPSWSDFLKQKIITLFRQYDIMVLTVLGQHDLKYHSLQSIDRVSIKVLESAGVILVLRDDLAPYGISDVLSEEDIKVYGASFGGEIPKVKNKDSLNILVIHKMIIEGPADKVWFGQRDYADAKTFLRKHEDFDLIVSGDNHQGFVISQGKRHLVNCGALMRAEASKEMWDHKPFIVIYDTESREIEKVEIPIKPPEEVLNREKIEEAQERNEKLEAFVAGLSEEYSIELDFRKNLDEFLMANEVEEGVKNILGEVLDERI